MTPITSLLEEAEPSMDDNENTRKAFEDAVFNRRFRASIQRNPNPPKGFGGLDFISTGCPTQAELCKRDASGDYEDDTVSAMWWGWCTGLARGCIPSHPEYRSSGERGEARTDGVPACGACPGDGTVCKTNCRLAEDSPTLLSDATNGVMEARPCKAHHLIACTQCAAGVLAGDGGEKC